MILVVTIDTTLPTILAALLGALLFELFRVIAVFRERKRPTGLDWFLSLLFVGLGALVPLLYGIKERNFLEIAQLGLSVPGLITGGFRVATASQTAGTPTPAPAGGGTPTAPGTSAVSRRQNYIALRPNG